MHAAAGSGRGGSNASTRESLLGRKKQSAGDSAAEETFEVIEECLYENQRWIGGGGWSSSHLMLLDRPPWSTASGKPRTKHQAQLPEGWEWADEDWVVDEIGLNPGGWCYGLCFGSAVGSQWIRFVSLPGNFLAQTIGSCFLAKQTLPAQISPENGFYSMAALVPSVLPHCVVKCIRLRPRPTGASQCGSACGGSGHVETVRTSSNCTKHCSNSKNVWFAIGPPHCRFNSGIDWRVGRARLPLLHHHWRAAARPSRQQHQRTHVREGNAFGTDRGQ